MMLRATVFVLVVAMPSALSLYAEEMYESFLFAVTFDATIEVDGVKSEVQNQVEVRGDRHLQIQFRDHEVRVSLAPSSDDRIYLAIVTIVDGSSGIPISADPARIQGVYGEKLEYEWFKDGLSLRLEFVVSAPRQ